VSGCSVCWASLTPRWPQRYDLRFESLLQQGALGSVAGFCTLLGGTDENSPMEWFSAIPFLAGGISLGLLVPLVFSLSLLGRHRPPTPPPRPLRARATAAVSGLTTGAPAAMVVVLVTFDGNGGHRVHLEHLQPWGS
jgi:hypothetical protein